MEPIYVDSFEILSKLPNHSNGEIAYVKDEDAYYMYQDGWKPVKGATKNQSGLNMNLYELNKSVVSQLPVFNEDAWNGSEKVFNDWFSTQLMREPRPRYFMLYGRDVSYFTVFRRVSGKADTESLFAGLKEILMALGDVYAIDPTADGSAIEIWVRYIDEEQEIDEMTCLYLFNYDEGVVTFNE